MRGPSCGIPVAVTCRVLTMASQPYYRCVENPVSCCEWVEVHRANALVYAHESDLRIGGVSAFVRQGKNLRVGRVTKNYVVARVRLEPGLGEEMTVTVRLRRGLGKTPAPCRWGSCATSVPAAGPNQLWLTGITEHPTNEGKFYLCAVKDVFDKRIVGYSIADRMNAQLPLLTR